MQHHAKQFAEELHKSLDDIGAPRPIKERSAVLSKMLHIPKQQALNFLEGHAFPDQMLLDQIGEELEIDITSYKIK